MDPVATAATPSGTGDKTPSDRSHHGRNSVHLTTGSGGRESNGRGGHPTRPKRPRKHKPRHSADEFTYSSDNGSHYRKPPFHYPGCPLEEEAGGPPRGDDRLSRGDAPSRQEGGESAYPTPPCCWHSPEPATDAETEPLHPGRHGPSSTSTRPAKVCQLHYRPGDEGDDEEEEDFPEMPCPTHYAPSKNRYHYHSDPSKDPRQPQPPPRAPVLPPEQEHLYNRALPAHHHQNNNCNMKLEVNNSILHWLARLGRLLGQCCSRLISPSRWNKKCASITLITIAMSAATTAAIVLTSLHFIREKQIDEEDWFANYPIFDCRGDGFQGLFYNFTNRRGVKVKRYLKYKFVDDVLNNKLYNFHRVMSECASLNSTLWEILDGEDEWKTVMKLAKDNRRGELWINAIVLGSCNSMHYETDYYDYDTNMNVTVGRSDPNICKEREALKGQGLDIKWPSSVYGYTEFSRLISGIDTTTQQSKQCVYVSEEKKYLWRLTDCETSRHWGLCIKRKCLWPEHHG